MLLFQKNDITFVTDLVWQRTNEEHYVRLSQMRYQCKFDLYCVLNVLSLTYGFVRLPTNIDRHNTPALTSLAVFVILSSNLARNVEDMFICFRFDANNFGYVFIHKNSILQEQGEFVGTLDEVKARIVRLNKEYGAKSIKIFDDVPLADDTNFAALIGIKIILVRALDIHNHPVGMPASDYYLWNQDATFLKRIESASLRTFDFWQPKQKRIAIRILAVIVPFCILAIIANIIYKKLYTTEEMLPAKASVNYIPLETSGVPAKIFISSCFNNIDPYLKHIDGWQLSKFTCTTSNREIIYEQKSGEQKTISNMLNDKSLSFDLNNATVNTPLRFQRQVAPSIHTTPTNLESTTPSQPPDKNTTHTTAAPLPTVKANTPTSTSTLKQNPIVKKWISDMQNYARIYNLKFDTNNLPTFNIDSNYSPIYLYSNHILDNCNLLKITMEVDKSGFYAWHIKGKLNVTK